MKAFFDLSFKRQNALVELLRKCPGLKLSGESSTMVTIKIECDCGQRYAFDVEPVNGQMTSPVACPACGADGTSTANDIIGNCFPPLPPPAPVSAPDPAPAATVPSLKVSAPVHTNVAPASRITANATQLGLVGPEQARHEARAKIAWGNSKESVIQYLMVQGFTVQDAAEAVDTFYKERVASIRVNGFKQVFLGLGFMLIPVIALGVFLHYKVLPMIFIGAALAAGLWGCLKILNGLILVVAPKVQSGDTTEQ